MAEHGQDAQLLPELGVSIKRDPPDRGMVQLPPAWYAFRPDVAPPPAEDVEGEAAARPGLVRRRQCVPAALRGTANVGGAGPLLQNFHYAPQHARVRHLGLDDEAEAATGLVRTRLVFRKHSKLLAHLYRWTFNTCLGLFYAAEELDSVREGHPFRDALRNGVRLNEDGDWFEPPPPSSDEEAEPPPAVAENISGETLLRRILGCRSRNPNAATVFFGPVASSLRRRGLQRINRRARYLRRVVQRGQPLPEGEGLELEEDLDREDKEAWRYYTGAVLTRAIDEV